MNTHRSNPLDDSSEAGTGLRGERFGTEAGEESEVWMPSVALVRSLITTLNRAGLSYCLWKGTSHLDRTLLADGDLDLLVGEAERPEFEGLLASLGFIEGLDEKTKAMPGVTHFLGLDEATGKLVHLHVYYRLVLDDRGGASHDLPVVAWLLSNTRRYSNVPVPDAAAEFLLAYVRSVLRADVKSFARVWLGRSTHPFLPSKHSDLLWLANRTTRANVLQASESSGLEIGERQLVEFFDRIRQNSITPSFLLRQKNKLLRQLRPWQLSPTPIWRARKLWRAIRFSRPVSSVAPIRKKLIDGGGLYMAIVGADGSGKTTLTRDLAAWLGRKIQTDHIYFGQPKRNATVTALRRGSQLLRRVGSHVEELGFGGVARRLRTAADLIQSVLWVHLARRRQRLDRAAWRERKRGGVILAERFPLRAFWGMAAPMDGPRLDPDDPRGPLFRRMAGLEQDRYVRVRSPDSVIILNARLKILRERKPETPPLEHKAKAQAVAEAVLCEDHSVIDAEQPYERMLLEGKRLVWRQLLSTAGAPARSARLAAEIPAGRTP